MMAMPEVVAMLENAKSIRMGCELSAPITSPTSRKASISNIRKTFMARLLSGCA
ncbi:hypothetical protein D3C71_2228740 [compost metagenome]